MNLFQKYGIKEVADVVFYSINQIGDEEFYTPVLMLDTLKVSTVDKNAEKTEARGGKGNKKLITWNYNKEITLNLEDALFSPASMSLIWGGTFDAKIPTWLSTRIKMDLANKYAKLNYSIKAFPSPVLTKEEWAFVELQLNNLTGGYKEDTDGKYIYVPTENNKGLEAIRKAYYSRTFKNGTELLAVDSRIINLLIQKFPNTVDSLGSFDTSISNTTCIERMEKCIVKEVQGFRINASEQKKNLINYYTNENSNVIIFYDAKTMLPLFDINSIGGIIDDTDDMYLKFGTIYYKFTRTIQENTTLTTLGRTFTIDAETFPGPYKIVGETYIRDQKTGQDHRYQIIIYRANISTNTSITLQAEGDPTTFSMQVDVLVPDNDIMMDLVQFDVEEDMLNGGTTIVPQKTRYTSTSVAKASPRDELDDNDKVEEIY